jgi:hypothetical protein
VTNDLTKLLKHVDEMRERVRQTAISEQSLVRDLADSLKALDQQLLRDVRQVAADHQARRGSILYALEDLADAIGIFRPQHEDALPKPVAVSQPVAGPPTAAAIPEQVDYGYQYSPPAGDWRQATKNLSLEDELELHLNGLNGKNLQH